MRNRSSSASVRLMWELKTRVVPPLRDALLALVLIAVIETEVALEHLRPYRPTFTVFAIWMGVLAWRRTAPFVVVLVGYTATLIGAALGVSQHGPFLPIIGVFLALYSLALYAPPRLAL